MTAATPITIADRRIGPGEPVYIVAEISANHAQSLDRAVQLVHAAADAQVDAVKLQTYTADTLTINSDRAEFRIVGGTLWDGRTLHDLYGEAFTPWEWTPTLQQVARERGISLFSTAFDLSAIEFLESCHVPAHKVASFEIVDLALIERMARTGKPLIISTGMASKTEIGEALATARAAGATQIVLLKCTSAYPAPAASMHLRTIPHLAAQFDVPVGLSDHTLGIVAPIAAVTLGAVMIEKHLTLARSDGGPDAAFSLEPLEFAELVTAIRTAEAALGQINIGPSSHEDSSRRFRRSLFVVRDMQEGDIFTTENVRSIRPAHGLAPKYWPAIVGRRALRAISAGTPLAWDLIEAG